MYYTSEYISPLGKIILAADGDGLCGLWFEGQKYFCATIDQNTIVKDDIDIFIKTKQWLDDYFDGKKPSIKSLTLSPKGSPFRQKVWQVLCEIPYGEVVTYSDISQKLGVNCAQAVGNAVGHNPISVIIPCHRVVGKNSSFTGYAGGIEKKKFLLELEGFNTENLFIPKKGTAL